jgi:type II secretory pathway component PulF
MNPFDLEEKIKLKINNIILRVPRVKKIIFHFSVKQFKALEQIIKTGIPIKDNINNNKVPMLSFLVNDVSTF